MWRRLPGVLGALVSGTSLIEVGCFASYRARCAKRELWACIQQENHSDGSLALSTGLHTGLPQFAFLDRFSQAAQIVFSHRRPMGAKGVDLG
jgi:hypothetical protein